MIYDFIIFENSYTAINHYKDLSIIARLLKQSGYTVAIADVFGEADNCMVEDVPHIKIKTSKPLLKPRSKKESLVLRPIRTLILQYKIERYLTKVINELAGQYQNLYAGSYHLHMPYKWLLQVPSDSSVFFWGLRSHRLTQYKRNPLGRKSLKSYLLYKYVKQNDKVKFFVSDEIIRDEFVGLGIDQSRLVIRPERMLDVVTKSTKTSDSGKLRLLTIGSLRKDKRIELALQAIKELNDGTIEYIIAGKSEEGYEDEIKRIMADLLPSNVRRLNYRIPEEEYISLIDECDYLLLCDKKQDSSVTNGTMNEALLKGKAIIAPNYNPYKYYIEKYKIGIMFDPSDLHSLEKAILKAQQLGPSHFEDNILKYQETLLFDKVVNEFSNELKRVL